MKKIYVAGPGVFRKDAVDFLDCQRKLIGKSGHIALIPLDKSIDFSQSKEVIRAEIFKKNVEHIQNCDVVIADLNNFRHNEQDAGTIWEIGMAYGLGKEIYIFSNDNRSLLKKTIEVDSGSKKIDGRVWDSKNMEIEDFGARFNLMISECATEFILGDFNKALSFFLESEKS